MKNTIILLSTMLLLSACSTYEPMSYTETSGGVVGACVKEEERVVAKKCNFVNVGGVNRVASIEGLLQTKIDNWKNANANAKVGASIGKSAAGDLSTYTAQMDYLSNQLVQSCDSLKTCEYRKDPNECQSQRDSYDKAYLATIEYLKQPIVGSSNSQKR
ncbi:MAG: hypothetical protein ACK53X_04940 [Holosporales bacterium]